MNKIMKNQIVVYIVALMLVVVGYLNYIERGEPIEISANTQNTTNIGDATLVSNDEIKEDIDTNVEESENDGNNQENITTSSNTIIKETDDYFTNSKLEREKMYSQMLETYQNILQNTTISEEQKSIASSEITKISNTRNAIMICENLISIKGFEEAVILANGESVNVVIKAEKLSSEEIAQIQNIITREMGTSIENIHIMKK